MKQQATIQTLKQTMPPQTRGLLPHAAVRMTSDHDLFVNSPTESRFGHNFSQVEVRHSAPIVSQNYSNASSSPRIQAKLTIGQPGDKYEQEADRVAEQVMRMPEPRLSSSVGDSLPANSSNSSGETIQRVCAPCSAEYNAAEGENRSVKPTNLCQKCRTQENGFIQTKPITPLIQAKLSRDMTPEVTPAINSDIRSLQGGGRPLSGSERSFFEPRFGADFSGVRVHDDARAAGVARSVNARAFTLGKDVVFGAGEYSSDGVAGRKFLAHELTHVIQQTEGTSQVSARRFPGIGNLSLPSIQRLPAREFRRQELQHQAEQFSDEEIQSRISELQTELDNRPRERRPASIFEEDHSLVPEQEILEPSLGSTILPGAMLLGGNQNVIELEALQWEQRRRERRAMSESFADRLDQRGSGWNSILPASGVGNFATTPGAHGRGGAPDRNPALSYPAGSSAIEPFYRGTIWSVAREIFLQRVRDRLVQVSVPTESGQLRLWGGRARRRINEFPGYVWGRRTDLPTNYADDYVQFWEDVRSARTQRQANAVGIELDGITEVHMWDIFLFLTGEGDPAAINTWDDQLLTVGAGFSGRSGNAPELYARMPPEFHDILYHHGIYIDTEANEFVVLDINRGAVVRGIDALRMLQVDQQRLSLLINTAMSSEIMSIEVDGEREETSARVWMLRANFEQFKEINRRVPTSIWSWPRSRRRYAFLLHHWMGSIDWAGMSATAGTRELAIYAYNRLRLRPRFVGREVSLWNRLQRSAHRAHAGEIGNRPDTDR